MAEVTKILSRKAKMLPCLFLILSFLIAGYVAFPYIWPYPSDLKFAATSKYHNIIVTGTMMPSKDLKAVSKLKINRIIKNTSGVTLSKSQIIALTTPNDRSTCLMKMATWPYIQFSRQRKKIGDHGILYAESEMVQNAEKEEEYIFRQLAFQSDNIVKRILLHHYKKLPPHNFAPTPLVTFYPYTFKHPAQLIPVRGIVLAQP